MTGSGGTGAHQSYKAGTECCPDRVGGGTPNVTRSAESDDPTLQGRHRVLTGSDRGGGAHPTLQGRHSMLTGSGGG